MENYLLELIRENNRIIIPNFGAFIVSREKGQNILFNNFLSFNDGLLISHICAVEGVNSATATQKVEDYVAQINRALDDKGLFEIEGIGLFTKDDNGVLRFEQAASELTDKSEVEGTQEAQGLDEEEFSTSDDSDLLDLETSGVDDIPEKTALVDEKEDHNRPDGPASYSAGSATASIPSFQEVDNTTEDIPEETASSDNFYISTEKRKRPVGLIILVILIFLLLAGSTLWFFTDVLDPFKPSLNKTPKTEQITKPAVVEESPAEEEPEIVQEEVIEEAVVVPTRQHHVIVGSFKEEALARDQMQVLLDKGYATASILPYEGRFLLSVEWYPSVNTALQRQEALLNELQMENWVLSLSVK